MIDIATYTQAEELDQLGDSKVEVIIELCQKMNYYIYDAGDKFYSPTNNHLHIPETSFIHTPIKFDDPYDMITYVLDNYEIEHDAHFVLYLYNYIIKYLLPTIRHGMGKEIAIKIVRVGKGILTSCVLGEFYKVMWLEYVDNNLLVEVTPRSTHYEYNELPNYE